MGRPPGAKNKPKVNDATLKEFGVSPLLTHLDHEQYWKSIADAERAKPVAERDHSLLEKAMDREAQAARDAGPYVHAKRATAAAQVNEKDHRTCVFVGPETCESSGEWLARSAPLELLIERRLAPIEEPRMQPLLDAWLAERGWVARGEKLVPVGEAPREEPSQLEIAIEKKVQASNRAIREARGVWEPYDDPNTTDEFPTPPTMKQ
jgi:hypothetical protein